MTSQDFETIINIEQDQNLYIIDKNYCYLLFNEVHRQGMKFAFDVEIEVGAYKIDYLPGPMKQNFLNAYQAAFAKELTSHVLRFQEEYLEFKFFPFEKDGEPQLLVKSRYVTDEIKSKQELEKYREMLEEMVKERSKDATQQRDFLQHLIDEDPSLIFLRDHKGVYRLVNKSLAKLLGKEPHEVVGRQALTFDNQDPSLKEHLEEDQQLLANGGTLNIMRSFNTMNHRDLWLSVRKKRVEIEGEYMVLGVMSNISELVASQRKLEKTNGELEETIADLKEMQMRLVTTEKIASMMLLTSGFMHEISNPINYVSGNVQPLRRDIKELRNCVLESSSKEIRPEQQAQMEELSEEIEVLLNGIDEGTQRVKNLVHNLKKLSHSHPESEGYVNFYDILEGVLTMVSLMTEEKRLEIKRDFRSEHVHLFTNASYLNQLLINVIDFVVSRMDTGECLEIATELADDYLLFSIKDANRELSDDDISRMEMPFEKIDEGMKVGLAISYRIAQKINGSIESVRKEGSTHFIIKLPVNPHSAPV